MRITINKNAGFTLVELIVVIVILSILATIAFLSFGSQSSSARDSIRLSDLATLSKGLGVNATAYGKFPKPDNAVNIYNSGNLIGYQGEVGTSVRILLKASSDGFIDPIDRVNYTYTINKNQNKFQILTFLENQNALSLFMKPEIALATSYSNRFPFVKGDSLGVLTVLSGATSITYTPIQDIASYSGVGVDIASPSTTASGITAYISNDPKSNTGGFAIVTSNYLVPRGTSDIDAGLSCSNLQANGVFKNGVYWLNPTGTGAFQAYCDMTTDGGGWTLVSYVKDNTITGLYQAGNICTDTSANCKGDLKKFGMTASALNGYSKVLFYHSDGKIFNFDVDINNAVYKSLVSGYETHIMGSSVTAPMKINTDNVFNRGGSTDSVRWYYGSDPAYGFGGAGSFWLANLGANTNEYASMGNVWPSDDTIGTGLVKGLGYTTTGNTTWSHTSFGVYVK